MTCRYCQYSVPGGEHRCQHCGRWAVEEDGAAVPRYNGATALAVADSVPIAATVQETSTAAANRPLPEIVSRNPVQPALFPMDLPSRNLLFQVFRKTPSAVLHPAALSEPAPRRTAVKPAPDVMQSTLDFLPAAPLGPRKLKTTVEAVIFCPYPVASPSHRLVAAGLDATMILIALGIFGIIFFAAAGPIVLNALTLAMLGISSGLIAVFYGVIWALYGRETAGMNWTHLRLINFDGFTPDGRSRALRMAGGCLSFCSGTIGLLWALVDEEKLTWHDHMSKTFPTLQESDSSFVQQR